MLGYDAAGCEISDSIGELETIIDSLTNKEKDMRNSDVVTEIKPSSLGHELFMEVANAWREKHGELPEAWQKYIDNMGRFTDLLIKAGEKVEDIKGLSLIELRNKCEEYEYAEVKIATASGGVTTKRININRAKAA